MLINVLFLSYILKKIILLFLLKNMREKPVIDIQIKGSVIKLKKEKALTNIAHIEIIYFKYIFRRKFFLYSNCNNFAIVFLLLLLAQFFVFAFCLWKIFVRTLFVWDILRSPKKSTKLHH